MSSPEERFELVVRRLQYLHHPDSQEVQLLLASKEKPRIAWAHVGYFVPLLKLVDFARAGLETTVYYGDVYAFLINYIHSMDVVSHRTAYYRFLVSAILDALGLPSSIVQHVRESSIANKSDWFIDFQKMSAAMTQDDARETMEEVMMTKMLSPMLCAIQQTLSEQYLDLDIQFGGTDQKQLFLHAETFLPKIGYRKRLHLMNPLIQGLDGGKMSSSKAADTKIMFLDDPETVERKINGAVCREGEIENNGILSLIRHVLLPVSELWKEMRDGKVTFDGGKGEEVSVADRRPFVNDDAPAEAIFSIVIGGDCGSRHFKSYGDIEKAFVRHEIPSDMLKATVSAALNRLLTPIRENFRKDADWQRIERLAYHQH